MKKIMFNDDFALTKAVLKGWKTMTRRMIPQEFFSLTWDERDGTLVYENDFGDFIDIRQSKYARYKVGEEVAIARSYRDIAREHPDPDYFLVQIARAHHVEVDVVETLPAWRNKLFVKACLMPRRIRITNIRVERLRDISDEGCIKEGIRHYPADHNWERWGICEEEDLTGLLEPSPREAFAVLIDKVSGRDTWAGNPLVVAYEFELVPVL